MQQFLTVDEILASNDIPEEVVAVPEWGGNLKVRGLSRKAYDAIGAECEVAVTGPGGKGEKKRDEKKFSDLLFLTCVVEPKFEQVHIEPLGEKSLSALNRVYEAIGRVLKTDVKAQADAKSAPGA